MKIASLLLCLACGASCVVAGPARPITAGQFQFPAAARNGPPGDPFAQRGQWFVNVTNASESARKWEFHDTDDSLSIRGSVIAIQWGVGQVGGYTNIAGFTILATVSNNLAFAPLPPGPSTNSHGEIQTPPQPVYLGMMHKARLVAEFAVAEAGPVAPPLVGIAPSVPGMMPPYYNDPGAGGYVLEAQNEPLVAWYCFSVPDPQNPQNPPGAYYVPAWDLGDIPPGGVAQVVMQFQVKLYGGGAAEMPFTDLRHGVLRHSLTTGSDVLYNRAESLKISHWIDLILVDIGGAAVNIPYPNQEPVEYIYASDVSVFFNGPVTRPRLNITPQFAAGGGLSGLLLDWVLNDVGPLELQYCDNLVSNQWNTLQLPVPFAPVLPLAMTWLDDGTVIQPPLQSPRFYRLKLP